VKSRRNRFTLGLAANQNDFLSPRRFGTTTSVDPFAPARGLFPAEDTPAVFPGAGARATSSTCRATETLNGKRAEAEFVAPQAASGDTQNRQLI
jgi:hypothetical protein